MSAKDQIQKLQSILARVQKHALEPRPVPVAHAAAPATAVPPSMATVPPSPDARAALEHEIRATPAPAPAVAMTEVESGSKLVAATPMEEEVLELDERHVVVESAVEINVDEEEESPPPPSSRRPKPLEEMPEPDVAHPAPPESGRHIAAQELDFEDDLTGVREARKEEPKAEPETISLAVEPQTTPKSRQSMELDIPTFGAQAPTEEHAPEPHVPAPAASQVQVVREPEVVRANVPPAQVASFSGQIAAPYVPKSFGDLLDASLSL